MKWQWMVVTFFFFVAFLSTASAQYIEMPYRTYEPRVSLSNQGYARPIPQHGRGGGYGGRFFGGGHQSFETRQLDLTVQRPFPHINDIRPPWGGSITSSE